MPGREQTGVVLGEDAPIFEVLSTMRAMRRLAPDPVPQDLLERLVQAATWAPSGSNAQAYQFVVVTDRDKMADLATLWRRCVEGYLASIGGSTPDGMDEGAYDRLREAVRYQADHFHETPALIVACYAYPRVSAAGVPRLLASFARHFGAGPTLRLALGGGRLSALSEASSIYPGVQNLLLAARSLGLAANLTTWHLFLEREFKDVLGIPREINTYALIPVGWPLGRFGPVTRRPTRDVMRHDGW